MSPTYSSWCSAKSRCRRSSDPAYDRYGAKGITFDSRWDDFKNFLADMGERPDGTSLDRVDNTRGYTKDNCRWADRVTQSNNRHDVHMLTYNGETKALALWARELGIKPDTLYNRFRKGWPVDKCLSLPLRKWSRNVKD